MFIKKFFNRSTMTYYAPSWSIPVSSSGEVVSVENALSVSAIYAAINIKANSVAKLPIMMFQKTDNGRQRITNHQVAYLMETRPNSYMSPYLFKHTMTTHRNLYGISYIQMEFGIAGKIKAIHLLNPSRVSVAEDSNKTKFYIDTTDASNPVVYSEDELLRIPYLTVDGFTPKSPISVARETAGTMLSQQKFLGSFYSNGTLTRGVLKIPTQLNKDAKDKVRQAWQEANSGGDNASKIAILDSGMEFQNTTIPLQDAEFIASMKYGVNDIARIFNVPPHMIAELDKATFSNIEQQSLDFILNTIQPEVTAIEEEASFKFFTSSEQAQGYYLKFNLASALRGDSVARANFYKIMIETGIMSINEVRSLEEMNSIENGDKHFASLNYTFLELMEEYQKTKVGATKEKN